MSNHDAVQEPKSLGAISPIWALIGIIMIVAIYTTIHGLHALTGSYVYAIPFGLVAQSILLIVSLNLGRDIARKASGRANEAKVSGLAGALRTLFLIAVYLLFFGICWFFAFSTYYNIFLARGDDVQTTASQAVQLGDQVLPDLVTRANKKIETGAAALRDSTLVVAFNTQLNGLYEAAARPEVGTTIAQAAYQASQDAYDNRRRQRDRWREELTTVAQRQTALQADIGKGEKEADARKAELEAIPSRMQELRRAIEEELTGVLPPLPEGAGAFAPSAPLPGAPAPGASAPGAPAGAPSPGAPAAATPAAKGSASPSTTQAAKGSTTPAPTAQAAKGAATPPRTPPVPPGHLRPDGLASTLVPKAAPCGIVRLPGRGEGGQTTCIFALETAVKAAEARLKDLPQEITRVESALEGLRAEIEALPKRTAELNQLLKDNPPLAAPPPRESGPAGRTAGPDLTPLLKARQTFAALPSEETYAAVGDACRPIEGALRGLKPPPPALTGFECRPEPVLAAIKAHRVLADAHRAFSDRCDSAAVGERTTIIVNHLRDDFARKNELRDTDAARRDRLGQTMDDVRKDVIDPCLALAAPLGLSTDDLNRKARAFEDKTSPRQTDFSLASNAVVQVANVQATPPAYLGALFAAAQELAILLLSILRDINRTARAGARTGAEAASGPLVNWGPDPSDPPVVAAAKIMLRAPGSRADGSVHLPAAFGDDEKSDIQANIQQLLRELRREGLAKPARFGGGMRLTPEAVEGLERRVKDHVAARRAEQDGVAAVASATTSPGRTTNPVSQSPDQGTRAAAESAIGAGEPRPSPAKDPTLVEAGQGQTSKDRNTRQIGTRT
jgi:predicted  nucleic acid-binding Zn-ribbon protein